MKERVNTISNIVVVGVWNRAVFTPDWVKRNLFSLGTQISVEFSMNPNSSLLYKTDSFTFCIIGERLCMNIIRNDDSARREMVSVFRNICRLLMQTPVTALGLNFIFEESSDYGFINGENATSAFIKQTQLELINQSFTRAFKISDTETLNLKVAKDDEVYIFDFNYNTRLNCINDIIELIGEDDDLLVNKHNESVAIISSIPDIYNK